MTDKAFKHLDRLAENQEKDIQRELTKIYQSSMESILSVLLVIYGNFEKEGKVHYEDLQRSNRYEWLMLQINRSMDAFTKIKIDRIHQYLSELYQKQYIGTVQTIAKYAPSFIGMGIVYANPSEIERSVRSNISGLTFDERFQKHAVELSYSLKQDITQGLIQQKPYREIAEFVRERMNGDFLKTERILQTEGNRVINEARLSAMVKAKEKGVRLKKKWVSHQDTNTRPDHARLNGVVIDVEKDFRIKKWRAKAPNLFGIAKEDVHCRCRIVAVFE